MSQNTGNQDNVKFVQSLYDAFGRGDIAGIVAAAHADAVWDVNGSTADHPLLGLRHGPDGILSFFKELPTVQQSTEFAPREFYAAQDKVFVLGHYAWKNNKTGRTAESRFVHVFTVRDGKLAGFLEFADTAAFAKSIAG